MIISGILLCYFYRQLSGTIRGLIVYLAPQLKTLREDERKQRDESRWLCSEEASFLFLSLSIPLSRTQAFSLASEWPNAKMR